MIWPCAMNGNITIFSFVGAIFEGWIETKNQEGERGGGGEGERDLFPFNLLGSGWTMTLFTYFTPSFSLC